MTEIIGDSSCPSCIKHDADRTGNHLILFSDGGAYCNRCGYSEPADTFTKPAVKFGKDMTKAELNLQILDLVEYSTFSELKDRGLNLHTLNHSQVYLNLS